MNQQITLRDFLERCPACRSASRGRTPQMFCQHRWHDTPAHPRPIESVETMIRIEEIGTLRQKPDGSFTQADGGPCSCCDGWHTRNGSAWP